LSERKKEKKENFAELKIGELNEKEKAWNKKQTN